MLGTATRHMTLGRNGSGIESHVAHIPLIKPSTDL